MSNEDWGPWVEHDGRGCPLQSGTYVQVEVNTKPTEICGGWVPIKDKLLEGIIRNLRSRSWFWTPGFAHVVRYRVKKPKGFKMLEELIQNLPAPTKVKEKT